MKEGLNKSIDSIISDYLSGSLDSSECAILVEWLKEDQKNTHYFLERSAKWEAPPGKELEMSWNALKIKRQLRESAADLSVNRSPGWGRKVLRMTRIQFARYAALFIIGLITFLLTYSRVLDYREAKQSTNWIQAETQAGQKTKIVLPDSTVVWLNSESVVSFCSNFETHKERIIKLDGEAFFHVADQGRSKFIVRCPDYDVEVKGTKFNVMAYKDFSRTETTLVEGEVQIRKGDRKISLGPGERAVASGNYLTKSKAHIRQATLWKENKFYFDNVPFRELARRLERWYDVKITLADRSLDDIYYSGYFKNEETVWQVLDVIQITTPIVYERKQFREITISRKNNAL